MGMMKRYKMCIFISPIQKSKQNSQFFEAKSDFAKLRYINVKVSMMNP